jgi:N-acetylglucosamine-6-phosphate deacetylase
MTEVIKAARVLTADDATWVAIDDGTIVDVGTGDAPADATDLGDAILAPGYIDIQINGIGDVDFNALGDAGAFARAEARLLEHGVTTFVPTLISAPMKTYTGKLEALAKAGAFGVHLEGPFLGGAPGAHKREYLRETDLDFLRSARDSGPVRIVTVAPEADPGLRATTMLSDAGVIVSIGHSTSSYDECRSAADAGARAVTHLYNGMNPLHHREPGVPGAALEDDRLTPSLIADLVHVHPAALKTAIARKRNVVLISDAVAVGTEWTESRGIRVIDGAPRLPDGTLAGSVLTLDRAVQNLVSIGVDLDRAVEMASTIPAELLGSSDRGRIAPGLRADMVALDVQTLAVLRTWKA